MTQTPTDARIAILGLGTMTGAILAGMLDQGVPAENVVATTRSAASAEKAPARHGVTVTCQEQDPQASHAEVARHDPAARAGPDDDRVVPAGALGRLRRASGLSRGRPGSGPFVHLHRPHPFDACSDYW